MRVRLGHVRPDAVVGLPPEIPSVGGQLAIRLGGSMSMNNSIPRITVVLLDTGERCTLHETSEVEVAEEDALT